MSKKRSRNKMFRLTQTIVKSKQKPSKKFELNQSIVSSKQNSGRRFGLDHNIAKRLAKHMLRRGFSISANATISPKSTPSLVHGGNNQRINGLARMQGPRHGVQNARPHPRQSTRRRLPANRATLRFRSFLTMKTI
jgi:hypothetical protein